MLTILLFASLLFVAFTNGANANFKGVASLYASSTTTLNQALYWGTAMTFLGCIMAAFMSDGLLKQFSGKGLVPDELAASPAFACSVALGTALTSFFATRFGFPVSTTHALLGSLAGVGFLAAPTQINIEPLVGAFLIPLFFSPFLAMAISGLMAWMIQWMRIDLNQKSNAVRTIHFLSAGGASFARGLNDAPKMAALFLVLPAIDPRIAILIVAIMVAIGGLVDARRVAETLGDRIAHMNPGQGMLASLVTFGLVTAASVKSMPVSTTHVSVGALLGTGTVAGQAKWKKAIEVFFAWISTVPCGAALAAICYLLLSAIG